jgi:hypothetical protein
MLCVRGPEVSHARFCLLRRPHDPPDRREMHTEVLSNPVVAILAGLISRYHRRISVGVLCFDHGQYPLVTPIRYPCGPYPCYLTPIRLLSALSA